MGELCTGDSGLTLSVGCKHGKVEDIRKESKNFSKRLLTISGDRQGSGGECANALGLKVYMPPTEDKNATVDVNISDCMIFALPQLFMDLSVWGLSTFSQSVQAKSGQSAPVSVEAFLEAPVPASKMAFLVEVNVQRAAVRLTTSWAAEDEYFEIGSDILVSLRLASDGTMPLDNIVVCNGTLRRCIKHKADAILCKKLHVAAKGTYSSSEDQRKHHRGGTVNLDLLSIKPLAIRHTVRDLLSLGKAITNLANFEADSAEPGEELWQRDPLALTYKNFFQFSASLEVENIQLRTMDDSLGRDQGARPAIEVARFGRVCTLR